MMKTVVLCSVCLCLVSVCYVNGVVQKYDVPLAMAQCFGFYKKRTSLTVTPLGAIHGVCRNMYAWMHAKVLNSRRRANTQTINYINAFAKRTKHWMSSRHIRRHKRQTGQMQPPTRRIRKEIRMMSETELQLFFDAVNSAKRNTSISPNKYDALAEFHTGMTSISAHGGCNFHGWHRMYLLMFENALREEGPQFKDVTIPYWDSRPESRMSGNPQTSAIFSNRLLGSCEGPVTGGLLGDGWNSSVGIITRNCGTDGPLFTDEMVHNVTRRSRLGEICGEDSLIDDDLEFHHNGGHRFIDGQMALLQSAVYDPIFWLHHNFVDLIWEMFRKNQKQNGVDPETDYPPNPTTMGAHELQLQEAEMGFASLTVVDGLSEMFTDEWYEFAPPPSCTVGHQDCGSKYLKCVVDEPENNGIKRAQCVARTLPEVIEWEEEQVRPPKPECKFPPKNNTPSDTIDPPVIVEPLKPVQNTFCMNGNSDIGQWVYIPVKIIFRRPPEYKTYGSYPVERGQIQKGRGDIYAPGAYSNVARHLRSSQLPAKYESCQEPTEPTNTIYVSSDGLNYEGFYKEYAIVDRRLAVTVATAYIAVRRPLGANDVSIAMLNAQDKCGRVCKPICKVPGTEIFRPCSGALKITGGHPLQFGNSFGDAVLDIWDFNTDANCPQLQTNNIVVSFYCDYKADWVWPTVEPTKHTVPTATVSPPITGQNAGTGDKHVGISSITEKPPPLPGCSLGWGCIIARPCHELTTCTEGETLACSNSCITFARCRANRFYVHRCKIGQEKAVSGVGCVQGHCDYANSGFYKFMQERAFARRRQRGGRWRNRGRRAATH